MDEKKALIAMSGGVDSSVAALLTQCAGYRCGGAIMRLYDQPGFSGSVSDAERVAVRLGMDFHVLDCTEDFKCRVIGYFIDSYESGLTPNPCIRCNRYLKFDRFYQEGLALGYHCMVTGHYAQIRQDSASGRYLLCKAVDKAKDQSYFLYTMTQEQLSRTLFPLGSLTKEQARRIAEENGFCNARKRDSQDICFVPDGDYVAFMKRYTGKEYEEGNYLDMAGNVIGRHRGAVCYTLGQRRGLGISLGEPAYVCGKNMADNTVTLGSNEALFSRELWANDWNWISLPALTQPMKVTAKVRHSQSEQSATVYPEDQGLIRVVFDIPQRAVTPGQAVVLYQEDVVVGGGTICRTARAVP